MMHKSLNKSHGLSDCRWLRCSRSCNVQVIDRQKLISHWGFFTDWYSAWRINSNLSVCPWKGASQLIVTEEKSLVTPSNQQVNITRVLIWRCLEQHLEMLCVCHALGLDSSDAWSKLLSDRSSFFMSWSENSSPGEESCGYPIFNKGRGKQDITSSTNSCNDQQKAWFKRRTLTT